MFYAFSASDSRSLRRKEGVLVARLVKEQSDTLTRSDATILSSLYPLERVSSSSPSGSLSGKSSGMKGSVARALSTFSAKSSAIFQRKRIPEFITPETATLIIYNELPTIVITPADNILYNSDILPGLVATGRIPTEAFYTNVAPLVEDDPVGGMDMMIAHETSSEDGNSSILSSAPSSGPPTPQQSHQGLPACLNDAGLQKTDPNMADIEDTERNAKESLDTLASSEIDLMFYHKKDNGYEDDRDNFGRQLVDPDVESTMCTESDHDQFVSSMQVTPTYSTIQSITMPHLK